MQIAPTDFREMSGRTENLFCVNYRTKTEECQCFVELLTR